MSRLAEIEPPVFEKYDAWGREINEIKTSEGWKFFKAESAKENLVSIPYIESS